jgi:hypothetical protein
VPAKNIFFRSSWYEDPRFNAFASRQADDPYCFEISVRTADDWPKLWKVLGQDLSSEPLYQASEKTSYGFPYYISDVDPIRLYAQLAHVALSARKRWLLEDIANEFECSVPKFVDVFLRRKFIEVPYKNRLEKMRDVDIIQRTELLFSLSNIETLRSIERTHYSKLLTDSLYTQFLDRYTKLIASRSAWFNRERGNYFQNNPSRFKSDSEYNRVQKKWFKLLYENEIEETEPFIKFLKEISSFDSSKVSPGLGTALTWDSIRVERPTAASTTSPVPLQSIPEPKPTPVTNSLENVLKAKPGPVETKLDTESNSQKPETSESQALRHSNNFGRGYGNDLLPGFRSEFTNRLFSEKEHREDLTLKPHIQKNEKVAPTPEPIPLKVSAAPEPIVVEAAPEEKPRSVVVIEPVTRSKHIDWSKIWG